MPLSPAVSVMSGPSGGARRRWRTEPGGQGLTPPTVVDGTVYVACSITTANGPGYDVPDEFCVTAVDAETGGVRWRHDWDLVGSPPTVVGDTVYVTAAEYGAAGPRSTVVRALDATNGDLRWQYDADARVGGGGPVVVDGTVYATVGRTDIGGDRPPRVRVVALDAATGDREWSRAIDHARPRAPVVSDGRVLALVTGESDAPPRLVALEAGGGVAWRTALGENERHERAPAVADGVAHVGHAEGVTALSAATGEVLWRHEVGGRCDPPTVDDGRVFTATGALTDEDTRHLVALDAADGSGEWRRAYGDAGTTCLTVADGTLYAGDHDGTLSAVDAASGDREWTVTDPVEYCWPTVADGVAYLADDRHLFALRTDGANDASDARAYHQTEGHADTNVATALTDPADRTSDTQVWTGDTDVYDPDGDAGT